MKNGKNYRLDLISTKQIKRLPGIKNDTSKKKVRKVQDFAEKHGYYMPVVLSENDGCMTLLSGSATFNACLERKSTKIPAVIVQTEGDADNLMLALQTAQLTDAPDVIYLSAAIVRLIDIHGVSRKHIADSLGKSPAWVSKMEGLSRKLNETVKGLVTEGHISSRTAQEIARLPEGAQAQFAASVGNEFLSKNNVTYLVNHYLNEDTSPEEKNRIIQTPALALPNESKTRSKITGDCSDGVRLSRAIARCLDDATFLSRLLDRIDADETAVRVADVIALADSLGALILKMQAIFYPGKNTDAGGGDRFD